MAIADKAKIGFALPQVFIDQPVNMSLVRDVATRAEALGYESLWTQEQLIGETASLEPITILSYVAAITQKARLGVSVVVLPQHDPVRLAKQFATLDQLSQGRLIVGIGIGGGRFNTGNGPHIADRPVRRLTEGLRVMRALWASDGATVDGEIFSLSDVAMNPKPAQGARLTVWFGARQPDALRRAVRDGDGWMGAGSTTVAEFKEQVGNLRNFLAEAGRDPVSFPISKRVYLAVDDDEARAEARLRDWFANYYGSADMASRVSLWGSADKVRAGLEAFVDSGAELLLLSPVYDYPEHLEALAGITGLKA